MAQGSWLHELSNTDKKKKKKSTLGATPTTPLPPANNPTMQYDAYIKSQNLRFKPNPFLPDWTKPQSESGTQGSTRRNAGRNVCLALCGSAPR